MKFLQTYAFLPKDAISLAFFMYWYLWLHRLRGFFHGKKNNKVVKKANKVGKTRGGVLQGGWVFLRCSGKNARCSAEIARAPQIFLRRTGRKQGHVERS